MSDNLKRRFWQIHLSTAVIAIAVSWMQYQLNSMDQTVRGPEFSYGWPIVYYRALVINSKFVWTGTHWENSYWFRAERCYSCIALDLLFALTVASCTVVLSEYIIRLHEDRTP